MVSSEKGSEEWRKLPFQTRICQSFLAYECIKGLIQSYSVNCWHMRAERPAEGAVTPIIELYC